MGYSHTRSILLEYRSHHALPRLVLKIYIRKYVCIYIHKGLVHVRIDDRLIHGQVAVDWCNAVNATRIMVANDVMYENDVQKAALRLVVPAGLKSSLLNIEKATKNLVSGKYEGQRVILVVRRPKDILRMMDHGVEVQEINVGNLPARDGTRNVKKSINVTDEEIKDFQELSRRGVKLTGKQVPDNADDDLMELINKL